MFYASYYLENKYLKEKAQNGEEKNLSLFLYSLKNTPFNGLNLNEADNLKAKNDIILEKYNENNMILNILLFIILLTIQIDLGD